MLTLIVEFMVIPIYSFATRFSYKKVFWEFRLFVDLNLFKMEVSVDFWAFFSLHKLKTPGTLIKRLTWFCLKIRLSRFKALFCWLFLTFRFLALLFLALKIICTGGRVSTKVTIGVPQPRHHVPQHRIHAAQSRHVPRREEEASSRHTIIPNK